MSPRSVRRWAAGPRDFFRSTRLSLSQLLRCLVGGVLMGWGSLLLPGGNDGLILVGMPLGWPYAWLAVAIMCLTIATRAAPHFAAASAAAAGAFQPPPSAR